MIQQTLFIDHLGKTTNSYVPKFFGNSQNYDERLIVNSTDNPVHIGSSFWSMFLENPYESVQTRNANFDYERIIRFKPKILDIEATHVETTSFFEIEVQNVGTENLTIFDVFTPSNEFFFSVINNSLMRPGEKRHIKFYYCPTKPGHFDSVFLIKTNKGEIPYSVTHYAYSTTSELTRPDLQYITQENISFTFEIPSAVYHKSTTIAYDGAIFNSVSQKNKFITLNVNQNMKYGY